MLCASAQPMQRVHNWPESQSEAVFELRDRSYSERSQGERFARCVVIHLAFDFAESGDRIKNKSQSFFSNGLQTKYPTQLSTNFIVHLTFICRVRGVYPKQVSINFIVVHSDP